jgi:hypothetical protein
MMPASDPAVVTEEAADADVETGDAAD